MAVGLEKDRERFVVAFCSGDLTSLPCIPLDSSGDLMRLCGQDQLLVRSQGESLSYYRERRSMPRF